MNSHPVNPLQPAMLAHQRGDLPEAIRQYRHVLHATGSDEQTLFLLGTALLQAGEFDEAADCLQQAADLRGDTADVHNNLAIALQALGRFDEAEHSYRAALACAPDAPATLLGLGRVLIANNQPARAESALRRAADLLPNERQPLLLLAEVLYLLERWEEAAGCLKDAMLLPGEADDIAQDPAARLGSVLAQLDRNAEAADLLRTAASRYPDDGRLLSNLSLVEERLGRFAEAEIAARRAVAVDRSLAEAWNHLGLALRGQQRLPEAEVAFSDALAVRPSFPLAEFNRAVTRLLAGDFAGGWPGYERRFEIGEATVATFGEPRWNGEPLAGRTILVVAEQGLGDAIQFCRLLPELANRGARVLFRCTERMHPLLATLVHAEAEASRDPEGASSGIELVAPGQPLPPLDFQVPLLSLPGLLQLTADSIPRREYWLQADKQRAGFWRTWLEENCPPGARKVGIAWQGAPDYRRDHERSVPLREFQPLADAGDTVLISLQRGAGSEQVAQVTESLQVLVPPEPFDEQVGAFVDTAAVLQSVDLLVCSDSAIAHLAGALGVTTWLATSYVPEWRWLLDRHDSPWYPSLRLFRQPRPGDWAAVFREMAKELRLWK